MEKEKCKYSDYCNAPLCPLDKESLEAGIWYPDEEVCRMKNPPKWIKNQKKIVKAGASPDYYFDYQMLNNLKTIRKGIKGEDPDKPVKDIQKRDEKILKREG
jgi:hypothetical protein